MLSCQDAVWSTVFEKKKTDSRGERMIQEGEVVNKGDAAEVGLEEEAASSKKVNADWKISFSTS